MSRSFIFIAILTCFYIQAYPQHYDSFTIKEQFYGSSSLNWGEYATKDRQAIIKDGYLEIQNQIDTEAARIFVDLPIDPQKDFEISTILIPSDINDKNYFGMELDYNEDFEQIGFLLKENTLALTIASVIKQEIDIKLSKKQKNINLTISRIGDKYTITINNVEVWKFRRSFNFPKLSFITEGKTTLKVSELIISQ